MAKHCIKLNEQNKVIKAYSTDFEPYVDGDIIVVDEVWEEQTLEDGSTAQVLISSGGRHFNLDLIDQETGAFKYEWNGTEVVEADLTAAKALKAKELLVAAAYNQMNVDVENQMALVFGTKNPDSANAYFQTWQDMIVSAAEYLALGIAAEKAIGSLQIGDALDTEAKIVEYATGLLASAKAYGIWRLGRIKQFKEERAAILA